MAPQYDLSRLVAVMSDRFEISESHNASDVLRYLVQNLFYEIKPKLNTTFYEGGSA